MLLIEPSSHFAHCLDEFCSAQGDRGRTHRCASHVLLRVYPTIKLRYFNSRPHEVTKPMLLIWWFAGGRAHGRGVELIVLQPLRASFSNVRILIGPPKGLDWPNPMSSIRTINTFGALGGALTSNVRGDGRIVRSTGAVAAAPPACAGSVPVQCPLPRAVQGGCQRCLRRRNEQVTSVHVPRLPYCITRTGRVGRGPHWAPGFGRYTKGQRTAAKATAKLVKPTAAVIGQPLTSKR